MRLSFKKLIPVTGPRWPTKTTPLRIPLWKKDNHPKTFSNMARLMNKDGQGERLDHLHVQHKTINYGRQNSRLIEISIDQIVGRESNRPIQ